MGLGRLRVYIYIYIYTLSPCRSVQCYLYYLGLGVKGLGFGGLRVCVF